MTVTLKIKNGIYHLIISYKDETGKWKQKSETTGLRSPGNKRAAEAIRKKREAELSTMSPAQLEAQNNLFLNEMEDWLTTVMPSQICLNTLDEYRRCFAYHVKSYKGFQNLPLHKLTPRLLQGFYNEKAKTLSPCSIRKVHSNINKFLKYAVSLDMIPSNPAQRVTLPKKADPKPALFCTLPELQNILSLFWDDPIESAVFLAVHLGLRRSEVCGLKWDAVDFENRKVFIRHTAVVSNGSVIYADHTKSLSSKRVLPMSDAVAEYLTHLKRQQLQFRNQMGNSYTNSGYVCTKSDGTPIHPDFVTHHFQRVIKARGIPHLTFHALRHSCASLLHNSGYDLKDIQTWLGHSDIQTTSNIYTHLNVQRLDHMAQAMGAALTPKLKVV